MLLLLGYKSKDRQSVRLLCLPSHPTVFAVSASFVGQPSYNQACSKAQVSPQALIGMPCLLVRVWVRVVQSTHYVRHRLTIFEHSHLSFPVFLPGRKVGTRGVQDCEFAGVTRHHKTVGVGPDGQI